MSEDNPYSSSSAPVAAEEVPPSRLRFYLICAACAVLLTVCFYAVTVLQLPPPVTWIGIAFVWMLGSVWVLWPEAKAAGGVRRLRIGRVIVVVFGVAAFTPATLFVLMLAVGAMVSFFLGASI